MQRRTLRRRRFFRSRVLPSCPWRRPDTAVRSARASDGASRYHKRFMAPIPQSQQRALVERLIKACGGGYSPDVRRKYYISGPQWAAAYEGHALFHAPTREPVLFDKVIEEYGKIGIGHWTTHDTD